MKNFLVASLSILVLVVGISASGAVQTNFGGAWVLDRQKSEGLQGRMGNLDVTMTVAQDDKQLTVETKYAGGERERAPEKVTYNLDGSETTAEFTGFMAGKGTLKAKRLDDGKTLELHSVRKANFQGNEVTLTITERWTLGEGGKVLQVQRTIETPRGARESKLVFNKQ